jgi:hypothetical protein
MGHAPLRFAWKDSRVSVEASRKTKLNPQKFSSIGDLLRRGG